MLNDFKKVFLFGIGSMADTYDKASKIVDEMVEKGKLTMNEGKELTEELKRTINTKTTKKENTSCECESIKCEEVKTINEDIKPLTKEDMICLLKDLNFATKSDMEDIKTRIENLENGNK